MDPSTVNESSFSSFSLAEIWPFSINGNGEGGGGLGLRMGNLSGFAEATNNHDVSLEESTVTENSGSRGAGKKPRDANSEDESSKNGSSGKRANLSGSADDNGGSKMEGEISTGTGNKPAKQSGRPSEPPKDYIHVRARRGQATDSHSLAERARREKISERMKILQDLVPGCNKVIGKALVLDEIINYIQSLQRQVEFLSMKLEAVNSRMDPTMEGFPSKNLGASLNAAGMIFGSQAPREYSGGSQPGFLNMQVGTSFERAT